MLVVLVNWRRAHDSITCIRSLSASLGVRMDVALVDNGSNDDSLRIIDDYVRAEFVMDPNLTVAGASVYEPIDCDCAVDHLLIIRSDVNLGFAGGNNLATRTISKSLDHDFIWYLNNDTIVDPRCLRFMLDKALTNEAAGIVGSTLIYESNRDSVQCFGGCVANRWTGLAHEIGNRSSWPASVDEAGVEREMDYVSGASMLVSSAFLGKVGPMSEDYFLFYEEWDWAVRACRSGFRLAYARDAIVYHKEGASIGTGKSQARSLLAEFYGLRSKLRFTRRFHPWALPTVWLISWLQVLRRLLQRQPQKAALMARVLLGVASAPQVR